MSRKESKPQAGVFIVESLDIEDEIENQREEKILHDILVLSGKRTEYWYVRTWKELRKMFQRFHDSNLRYLHISCHGSTDSISLTFDTIRLRDVRRSGETVFGRSAAVLFST